MDTSDVLDAILNRPPLLPQPPVQDDLTTFMLGLGATMKTFNPVRLANVKFELANIVGRADIQNAVEKQNEIFNHYIEEEYTT